MERYRPVLSVALLLVSGCPEADPEAARGGEALDAAVLDARVMAEDAAAPVDAATLPDSAPSTEDADAQTDAIDSGRASEARACPPGSGIFAGGGNSFGLCAEECHAELSFVFPVQLATSTCLAPQVSLTVYGNPRGESKTTLAYLTDAAWDRAADIGLSLRDAELETTYGCPDCNDGGGSTIVLDVPGKGLVDVAYEWGNPPPVLAEADAFMQALIRQLSACAGADIRDCTAG